MAKYFVKFKYDVQYGVSETQQAVVALDGMDIFDMDSLRHSILYQANIHRQYKIDILMLVKIGE